jgi:hypothetical protein
LHPFGSGIGIPLSSFIVLLTCSARDGAEMLRNYFANSNTLFSARNKGQ